MFKKQILNLINCVLIAIFFIPSPNNIVVISQSSVCQGMTGATIIVIKNHTDMRFGNHELYLCRDSAQILSTPVVLGPRENGEIRSDSSIYGSHKSATRDHSGALSISTVGNRKIEPIVQGREIVCVPNTDFCIHDSPNSVTNPRSNTSHGCVRVPNSIVNRTIIPLLNEYGSQQKLIIRNGNSSTVTPRANSFVTPKPIARPTPTPVRSTQNTLSQKPQNNTNQNPTPKSSYTKRNESCATLQDNIDKITANKNAYSNADRQIEEREKQVQAGDC